MIEGRVCAENTGGAWDNAKKYTEKGELNGWYPSPKPELGGM